MERGQLSGLPNRGPQFNHIEGREEFEASLLDVESFIGSAWSPLDSVAKYPCLARADLSGGAPDELAASPHRPLAHKAGPSLADRGLGKPKQKGAMLLQVGYHNRG